MKIIYLSLLSIAIIAEGTYFYCDHQSKQQQAQLAATFREQASTRLSQLETQTNNEFNKVDAIVQAISKAQDIFIQKSETNIRSAIDQLQTQAQNAQQKNEAVLEAAGQQASAAAMTVENLKKGALAQLQETEEQLVLLKKEQIARANEADNRWKIHGIRHVSELGQ
jgi:hypothetical protein